MKCVCVSFVGYHSRRLTTSTSDAFAIQLDKHPCTQSSTLNDEPHTHRTAATTTQQLLVLRRLLLLKPLRAAAAPCCFLLLSRSRAASRAFHTSSRMAAAAAEGCAGEGTTSPFSGRKLHQTALALLPEEGTPLHAAIQSIRLEHDKQFNRWMPHINVLYPFVPEAEFETAAHALHRALAEFGPIDDCAFTRIGHFEHGKKSCTAWLAPQQAAPAAAAAVRPAPHPALLQLQAACQAAVPHCNDLTAKFGGRFTPHLSLGQFGTPAEVEAFRAKINWQPLPFPITQVRARMNHFWCHCDLGKHERWASQLLSIVKCRSASSRATAPTTPSESASPCPSATAAP